MKACHRERGAAGVVFDRDRYIDGIGSCVIATSLFSREP
jgi:hypothetical protein